MTRYKLQTYQFGIVSGIRQEQSDAIVSAVPGNLFAPEARKGQLFVLTEAVNAHNRGKEACDLVARTIVEIYYNDRSFSITASLRKALKHANSTLYQHNFKAAQYQKTAVSVTCAVLRDNDLYLAQVQPTQVYIAHKGQLRALPTYPSWEPGADSPALMRPNALGTSLFSEPELFRNVVEPGDQVVLCSSRLARVLGRSEAERLFCLEDAPSALEELYAICRRNTLTEAHVALIELVPLVNPAHQGLSPEGIGERSKAAISVVGDWLSDVTGNAALTLRRPSDGADDIEPPDASDIHPTSALTEAPALPPLLEDIDARDMNWLRGRPRYRPRSSADEDTWPASAYLGEGTLQSPIDTTITKQSIDLGDHEPLPIDFAAIPQRDPLPPKTFWQRLTTPFRVVVAALVTLFANLGRGRRPSAPALPRFGTSSSGGLSYRRKKRRLPIVQLVLLIAALASGYFYFQYKATQDEDVRYNQAFNQAENLLMSAQQAPSDEEALRYVDQLDLSLDALSTDPLITADLVRGPRYRALQSQSEQLRASITQTSLLSNLELVTTMPLSDTINRLLVANTNTQTTTVYFVGAESGVLYRQTAGSISPTVVLKDRDTLDPFVVGPIRSMVWREGALVAIDGPEGAASSAYLSNPQGTEWTGQLLDGSEFWPRNPFPDIESFGGNLYIWEYGPDADGQIQKYASGEFASLPSNWIVDLPADVNIRTAIDMAIDGQIYLLQSTGEVLVFDGGVYDRTIPSPDVQPPVTTARKLFVTIEQAEGFTENQGHIFVLDPLQERVVEMTLDGTVIQQMRVPASAQVRLNQLSDLAVTFGPQGRQLYLANGNQIWTAPVPPPPAPRDIAPASGTPAPTSNVPTATP